MRHPHGDLWTLRTAAAARGGAAEHPGVTVSLESWEKKFNNSELVVSEVPLPNITRAWREAFPDCMAALREQRDFYIQHSQTSRRSASCPLKADDSASKSRGWQADYETGCTVRNAGFHGLHVIIGSTLCSQLRFHFTGKAPPCCLKGIEELQGHT
ncbi:uncharacterized protein [Myotis yumanensis]|uniref:uncharacterized protein isoform X3 n=1 Tax=Myotis yumanensis TaxID=159337 RepID=UPI0038D47B8A